ncbi:MAG TPA: hypothetical protein VKE69_10350 [Planctomycetota bacterium]|nr:hypothetical protein [Planctomycetota bacterium]
MLPRRDVLLAQAAAGAFGLVAGLSLLNGVDELSAAVRGMVAAAAAAAIAPAVHRALERLLAPPPSSDGTPTP